MHEPLWDFEIQTDYIVSAKLPEFEIINKKRNCRIVDFTVTADHRLKLKEIEKDKYQDRIRELKRKVEHESDGYTNYNWHFW